MLFEKVLIYLLDMEDFLDSASYIVADHKPREMRSIDKDDAFAKEFGSFFC